MVKKQIKDRKARADKLWKLISQKKNIGNMSRADLVRKTNLEFRDIRNAIAAHPKMEGYFKKGKAAKRGTSEKVKRRMVDVASTVDKSSNKMTVAEIAKRTRLKVSQVRSVLRKDSMKGVSAKVAATAPRTQEDIISSIDLPYGTVITHGSTPVRLPDGKIFKGISPIKIGKDGEPYMMAGRRNYNELSALQTQEYWKQRGYDTHIDEGSMRGFNDEEDRPFYDVFITLKAKRKRTAPKGHFVSASWKPKGWKSKVKPKKNRKISKHRKRAKK